MIIDSNIREYLLVQMVNAVLRAGAAIMDLYRSDEQCEVMIKSDKSPLIEADHAAHAVIREALGATRIPILSEEGREMLYDERKSWDMFWLVDPLDGTQEFIHRSDQFTVNIALMSGQRAIASVIYAPSLSKLYVAGKGLGAHLIEDLKPDHKADSAYADLDARAIPLPLPRDLSRAFRVAVTRSHVNRETHQYIAKIRQQHPNLEIVEQGSSYKFCMLAEGSVDYYPRTSTTSEWDTAAGELILAEAGGEVRSLEGGAMLRYNKEDLRNPWFECWGV